MIRDFVDHTPILGELEQNEIENNDAEKFESLLQICEQTVQRKFQDCEIGVSGICSFCKSNLDATPLTIEDANQLQRDIETTLIEHACSKNPKRQNAIRAGFKAFQNHVRTQNPTILLDGANLGYYGLSSWYHLAKKEKMEEHQRKKGGEKGEKEEIVFVNVLCTN